MTNSDSRDNPIRSSLEELLRGEYSAHFTESCVSAEDAPPGLRDSRDLRSGVSLIPASNASLHPEMSQKSIRS